MKHCIRAAAAIALTTLGLSSCDHSPTMPRLDQLTFDVVSGDAQTSIVGTQLAPLVVKVTSGGNPVAQQILNFRVLSGGGSVYGGTELTDNDGIAQELWTLGTIASQPQQVEVRAVESSTGAEKVFATFSATALPDNPKFDVITSFDAIHDMVDPRGALRSIRRALAEDAQRQVDLGGGRLGERR